MRLQNSRWLSALPILILFLAIVLNAQTTTSGGLTGVIVDQSNAVVPGCSVEIIDDLRGTIQTTKTDREGVYRFHFLTPSTYILTVTCERFRRDSRTVTVLLGPPGTVNIKLEIAKTNSEITVADEAPLIQAENGDLSATMNQKQISEVPNPGNDLTYIVQTAPGVVTNTDSQSTGGIQNGAPNFSMLGMPGSSYYYTMDGMSITDSGQNFIVGGSLGLVLGQNQIQEATIISTGYSGQFGGAAGGNVNYFTKSGTKQFHGNAQYYWNGRVLNANDWFNNAFGNPRPFSIANQWAGSLSGPIKQSKLFFFFDTEGLRLLIPQVFDVTIPSSQFETATSANIDSRFGPGSASDVFYRKAFKLYNSAPGSAETLLGGFSPGDLGCAGFTGPDGLGTSAPCAFHFVKTRGRPSQDTLTSGRVDWNWGANDRIFLRVQGEDGVGAFYTDSISSLFDADYNVHLWQGQLEETHTFSPAAASQLLISGFQNDFTWKVKNFPQALGAFPTVLNFSVPGTFTSLGGADWIGSYGCHCTQYQILGDLVRIWGKQKFGLGASFSRPYWRVPPNTVNAVGQLFPQTLKAFYEGGIDPAATNVDFTTLAQSFTSQSSVPVDFLNFGAYGQDEWQLSKTLTLTIGLRAEHYANPSCESNCFSRPATSFDSISHNPDQPYNQAIRINQKHALIGLDNILWSPRLSFAWQPLGVSRSSVLRGGFGVFYDPLRDAMSESFYINAPVYNSYVAASGSLAPNETNSLFGDTAASNAAFVNGFAAGETLAQIQAAAPNFLPPALNVAPKMMHLPQYQRWSLEWQQSIGGKTSLSISYVGHHGVHELVGNPSANAFGFGSLPSGQCTSRPAPPCSDPRFSEVLQYGSDAVSNYNGVVASFRHQVKGWGNGVIQVNYTYSHAFDEVSNGGFFSFNSGSSLHPQDPKDLRGAYGPAEYDVLHSLNGSYVWELPMKAFLRGRGPSLLTNGWQISGTIFGRTGLPYTVFDNFESGVLQHNNYFSAVYAVPVLPLGSGSSCGEEAAFTVDSHPCQPPQFLSLPDGTTQSNPNALFVQAGCETGFNAGHLGPSGVCDGPIVPFAQRRNRFRGPGYFNSDFAITKHTMIPGWEHASIGIGLQFFNVFNHPNFGFPDNLSSDAAFGQIFYLQQAPTGILGSGLGGDAAPRMIQLKAELKF